MSFTNISLFSFLAEAVRMFEGNTRCTMCDKEMDDSEKNFGISMCGFTYVFCDSCFNGRKKEITELLHD